MEDNMRKKLLVMLSAVMVVAGLTACNKLDVVGDTSKKSFKSITEAIPDQISSAEDDTSWVLTAPDGMAKFIFSKDFSKSEKDVMLEIDAKPFLDAGLDASKLPEGILDGEVIRVGADLGDDTVTYKEGATPSDTYNLIVKGYRDSIKYHTALDHYGVDLMNGNMFEWAKDMSTNDKDIVFVLNPQVFIDAGVNPDNVEGWVFAKVETMDENNKKIQVDKFLKPFDLDGKN